MINVSFSPSKSKRIMSHCLAIFHKQSGDWVSLEATLKPLSRASGSKVGLITGSGVQPLISLMPNIGFRRTPIRRAYDALRCFDDGKNSAFYAFKSKPKSTCLGYYASRPRRPQRPSRAKGQVECGSSSHFGSVATLQVTRDRLAGCSSWPLRFAVYSNGVNSSRRSSSWVGWYLRFSLSYRDVEELLAERGLLVDHVTVWRWVQR